MLETGKTRFRRAGVLALPGVLATSALLALPAGTRAEASLEPDAVKGLLVERSFEFSYRVTADGFSPDARSLSLWVPLPRETEAQKIEALRVDCALPHRVVHDAVYGNQILYVEAEGELPERVELDLSFTVRRQGYRAGDGMRVGDLTIHPADLERFTRPNQLVPADPVLVERARRAVGDREGTMAKARAIYDDVLRSMKYDKSGEGWGRGDALYACDIGRGNCTDFHSLFIAMARATGIPARFVIGFPVPAGADAGQISGYHCWAEFHDRSLGWVPVDASEAWKHPEMREFLFGGLDANRVEFTLGRDIVLTPEASAPAEPLNYFIYPQVLVDDEPHGSVAREFTFKDRS